MIWKAVVFCFLVLGACSPRPFFKKELQRIENSLQEHAGFALYDPAKKEFVLQHNSNRYFTPASNTKIFTFYTSLRLLGDTVASLRYEERNDSLFFQGLGDPSFLYPNTFQSDTVFNFLKSYPGTLCFSPANFFTDRFGPGWAWDDYLYAYSPERSSFPIYGNLIRVDRDSLLQLSVQPKLFKDSLTAKTSSGDESGPVRESHSNGITLFEKNQKSKSWSVPLHYSDQLLSKLLTDTIKRAITVTNKSLISAGRILKSIPTDSLYRVMMQDSDNFIAEQLLLQCAGVVSDSLQPEIAIRYSKKNFLSDLPDVPEWVDGSGLSRYNLFTPRSVVRLWEKIAELVPQERLFKLVAIGGKPGTLQNLYKNEQPYVFGKTGSLSNNHCLSGFVQTKKGRTLIFSFMHNNFVQPTRVVRGEMEKLINHIHEKF
jgi:serine-type D-Ala-D-Ala carboxypeptidase/endopeptidase (penicillin-binding protein 4)